MTFKKLKKFEDWNVELPALLVILALLIGILLGAAINPNPVAEKKIVCYDMVDFNNTLTDIGNKCGSTYITKEWGSNDWSVFGQKCNSQGYCKYDYTKLEDCLNGENLD